MNWIMQRIARAVYRYGEKCAGMVSYKTTYEPVVPSVLKKKYQITESKP